MSLKKQPMKATSSVCTFQGGGRGGGGGALKINFIFKKGITNNLLLFLNQKLGSVDMDVSKRKENLRKMKSTNGKIKP